MNERIKKWNMKIGDKLHANTRFSGRQAEIALVVIRVYDEKDKKSATMRISFHEKVMKQTGWMLGDVINTEIKDGEVCMFRDAKGRQICGPGPHNTGRKYVRYRFPESFLAGFPQGAGREVQTSPGMLVFLLPEQ